MTLANLELDQIARITSIQAAGTLSQRLLAMGFLPGTRVRLIQVAPFGDPIAVELDGWRVSVRRSDASSIEVQPAAAAPGAA